MPNLTRLEPMPYDPRWFIWTIVFLIVSGVSLVSYIIITGSQDSSATSFVTVQHTTRK